MNRSGDAVAALARYYDVAVPICSSWSTRWRCRSAGCARARAGSAGGHNGLKSCIERLGTTSLPGFGWEWGAAMRGEISRITCSRHSSRANVATREFIARAADAAEMFAAEGIAKVMNTYNPDAADPDDD
jgi:PTH1 family peptidyl-tRNA hydrolase